MAETDRVSEGDRIEQAGLERAIADVERVVLASPPGTRPLFNSFLLNARARLGVLEKKIHDAERDELDHATNEAAIGKLAQQETNLSAKERETYSGFLKESFFTKADFGRLENFYTKSWDRLSDHGKDEMSSRVWEGIRKGKYTFGELPQQIREKEMERAYGALAKQTEQAQGVPAQDRNDFIHAYEGGAREETAKILQRDSFKQSLFRSPESARSHEAATAGRDAEKSLAIEGLIGGNQPSEKSTQAAEGAKNGDRDLSAFAINGVKLADVEAQGSSAEIPNARTTSTKERGSTPGG